jgi:hypothetical protein
MTQGKSHMRLESEILPADGDLILECQDGGSGSVLLHVWWPWKSVFISVTFGSFSLLSSFYNPVSKLVHVWTRSQTILEDWTQLRAVCLLDRCSTTWAMPQVQSYTYGTPCSLFMTQVGNSMLRLVQPTFLISLSMPPCFLFMLKFLIPQRLLTHSSSNITHFFVFYEVLTK